MLCHALRTRCLVEYGRALMSMQVRLLVLEGCMCCQVPSILAHVKFYNDSCTFEFDPGSGR